MLAKDHQRTAKNMNRSYAKKPPAARHFKRELKELKKICLSEPHLWDLIGEELFRMPNPSAFLRDFLKSYKVLYEEF